MPQEARKHRLRRCEKCGTSFVDRTEQSRFCAECQIAHDLPEEHVLGGEVVAVGAVEEISCGTDTWSSSSEISVAELNQLSANTVEPVEPVEPPQPVEQPPKTTWKSAPFPVHYVGSKSKGSLPAINQVVDPRSGKQGNSQPASGVAPEPEWDPKPETHYARTFLLLIFVAALLGLAALFYYYPNWHVEVRRRWAAAGQVPAAAVASIPVVSPTA
jgi:hypothetical protein